MKKIVNIPQNNEIKLSDYAKKKLEYIIGHSIVREFPHQQPSLEWTGAVIDLLEELKLYN
jgi:hypothetical protein